MASRETHDTSTIIKDPLKWQAEMDNAPVGINMKGSARFWSTVANLLGDKLIIRNGAPEFSEMDIQLSEDVWLRLSGSEETDWIDSRFVSQEQIEKDHSWIEWIEE